MPVSPPVSKSAASQLPLLALGVQVLLALGALALGAWQGVPWLAIGGTVLAIALAAAASHQENSSRSVLLGWWAGALLALAALLLGPTRPPLPLLPKAVFLCLLGASALMLSARLSPNTGKATWRLTGLLWTFPGLLSGIGTAYAQNLKGLFYLATLLTLGLLCLYIFWYRPRALIIQSLNTVILLSTGLLLVGLFQKDPETAEPGPDTGPIFRYADARQDPAGFRRWWLQYRHCWASMLPKLFEMHPGTPLFYRPRPDSHAQFWHSQVRLNHLGFRGHELAQPKGNTYRIVALGESTTFGVTLNPGEQPWPELLEQLIRERLHPARPVEVVNAGIPSYCLTNNLLRLSTDILPLKPDLLLSYHGYNGFPMLYPVTAPERTLHPPEYAPRPIKLLADCEYHLRVLRYRRLRAAQHLAPAAASQALQTDYARAYRTLIQAARTNSIPLVLATYSMAVNRQSDPCVIAFYQEGFPDVSVSLEANEVHSLLVRQVCAENPDVLYVDTRPGLDGQYDLFLDLMHFTPEGDRRLAEAMFQAIKPVLERDLGVSATP